MNSINFDSLQKYESPKQRAKWEKMFAQKKSTWRIGPTLAVIGALVAFWIAAAILDFQVLGPVLLCCAAIAVIVARAHGIRSRKRLKQATGAFALDNGWQVMPQDPTFRPRSVTPSDSSLVVSYPGPSITGQLDDCSFWLYQYQCTTSKRSMNASDKSSVSRTKQRTANYHILTVALPAHLPAFFLDSRADGQQKEPNDLFVNGVQKLSLEGNFDSSFTLYQEPNNQIDVLSIITPEFMQKLMDSGAYLNIESDGQYLHFVSIYGNLLNCTPTRRLFEQSRVVLAAVLFKLRNDQPTTTVPTA